MKIRKSFIVLLILSMATYAYADMFGGGIFGSSDASKLHAVILVQNSCTIGVNCGGDANTAIMYNGKIEASGAGVITLPPYTKGMRVCILNTIASAIAIKAGTSDAIIYNAIDVGTNKRLNSGGATSEQVCVSGSVIANKWRVWDNIGTWTAGGL